jgi:hypothetical protein
VFLLSKEVGDSGDAVNQKQRIAIFETRAPVPRIYPVQKYTAIKYFQEDIVGEYVDCHTTCHISPVGSCCRVLRIRRTLT